MNIKSLLVALVVSLSLAAPVLAGPYEDGRAAFKRGDFKTALQLLRPLAEKGNSIAQNILGIAYQEGLGVEADIDTSLIWYRKAAEQGNAESQHELGTLYGIGWGVPKDKAMSLVWHRKAAEQGYAPSQGILGFMYSWGEGVPQDYVMAHMWYNLTAAQGDSEDRKILDNLSLRMTPAQIAEAQRLAREWKPKKVEKR